MRSTRSAPSGVILPDVEQQHAHAGFIAGLAGRRRRRMQRLRVHRHVHVWSDLLVGGRR
jgi:hypothetical protein